MALISWGSQLSTKVQQIDDQHVQLVDLLNQLHDALIEGRGHDVLGAVLDGLINYTTTHFTNEEQLMTLHDYPEISSHKEIHETLVNQVLELQHLFATGTSILTLDVMMFLKDWLVNHIQGDDKKFGAYLNTRGIT